MVLTLCTVLLSALARLVDVAFNISDVYREYVRRSNPVILESATGFGLNLALALDIALRLDGRVYSIDISGYSTALAKFIYKGFISRGILKIERGDLRKLHYADSTFDYSVNHTTMHHIDPGEIPTAVRELWRTLKKGGLLVVADINPLPVGIGAHSPGNLRKAKEATISSIESLFKVVEFKERRLSYHIVAEK
jgi:Methylase involved in ubiquinone/menaquinone biosynthesis